MNPRTLSLSAGLLIVALLPVACSENKPPDPNAPYIHAIDAYLRVHPLCLWTQPVKMPTQEFSNQTGRTAGYEALAAMGFLQRIPSPRTSPTGEKINDYDLTDKGREAWVPVKASKGYGDLCYGHRSVDTVDSVSVAEAKWNASMPETATVLYHYAIKDQPDWAANPALQTAFPAMAAMINGRHNDNATLIKTSSGWVMTAPAVSIKAAAAADAAKAAGAASYTQ